MTWGELKELAEEAGVKDDTVIDVFICEGDTKEDIMLNKIDNEVWFVQ